ncbi:hypothetical protein [[Flexibacter] sp. ATCC 35208]|uniref:hypothetical protein n=1 Tax=[Flexibacter] sp. ATCC 35208 TaxID=1936242 RepID=UPI0009D58248|nr:hypothetical protein [[Flexibacter] sp. ATCC 35208]OMP74855.1 hypothetical protein BW716_33210 [[Flexibacter] sp. ATCC 35208]
MKKARILLLFIVICLAINGLLAFKVSRGLSNLYLTTTGIFVNLGASSLLTYATLSPYRTFPTDITQSTVAVTRPLYTGVTLTITIIGGGPYTYTIATGSRWSTLTIYDDEDQ